MKKDIISRIYSILVIVVTPIFFIALAAFFTCIFRPFYYMLIGPLKIEETSGYSREVIVEAFDDVMNFMWNGAEFKTGQLAWTEEEKAHFEDCIPLFRLQLILTIVLGIILLTYVILIKLKIIEHKKVLGISPVAYGGAIAILILAFVGIFAAIDFDKLFEVFHHIAFPGKENWMFDYNTEQVINILPESFFLACVILIISIVVLCSIGAILFVILTRTKKEKNIKDSI